VCIVAVCTSCAAYHIILYKHFATLLWVLTVYSSVSYWWCLNIIYCSLFISHACIFCVRFWFQFLHLVVLKSSVFCWKLIGIVWTWRFQYIFLLVLPKRYTSEKPTILSIVLENVLKYRLPVVKNKDIKTFYFASRRGAKYCDLHVCMSVHLSVCLLAYLKKDMSKLDKIFCACYLWS